MKKKIKKFALVFLVFVIFSLLFFSIKEYNIIYASSTNSNRSFGSPRITGVQSEKIKALENNNYKCDLKSGTTFDIRTGTRQPTSYFIPESVKPVTGSLPSDGRQILGLYSGTETIICTKTETIVTTNSEGENVETTKTTTQNITLPKVIYYGTSTQRR